MMNCEGCYYEEHPQMEACNLCERDQDGDMTGWVPRSNKAAGVVTIPQSAAPTAPFTQGGLDQAAAELMDMEQDVDWNDEHSREEGLLKLLELKNKIITELRDRAAMQELLIEEQRKQIDAWREEIDVLRGEREDLRIMLEKAKGEANYYKECLADETRLRELAYAKLDMVHLIFGGGNNA